MSNAFGILIVVTIVSWYLIFPAMFLTIVAFICRFIYIKSARDIKRYEGLSKFEQPFKGCSTK